MIVPPPCSFCGKTHREVEFLSVGPASAAICDECIDIASGDLARFREEKRTAQRDVVTAPPKEIPR